MIKIARRKIKIFTKKMKKWMKVSWLTLLGLTLVAGVNLIVVGTVKGFNLVSFLFGKVPMLQNIVYVIGGVAVVSITGTGLYMLIKKW